jgi:hypothetical protein
VHELSGLVTNMLTRMEKRATLSHNNVSRNHILVCGKSISVSCIKEVLARKFFDTKTLTRGPTMVVHGPSGALRGGSYRSNTLLTMVRVLLIY